jgi:hypothetical protein
MRGKGPRIERETIIRFDEVRPTAEVWTASEPIYRKLLKQGHVPKEDGERSATFEVLKRSVAIKTRKALTDKQREVEALEERIAPSQPPGLLGYEGQPGNQGGAVHNP